jgi:hypothetical protein
MTGCENDLILVLLLLLVGVGVGVGIKMNRIDSFFGIAIGEAIQQGSKAIGKAVAKTAGAGVDGLKYVGKGFVVGGGKVLTKARSGVKALKPTGNPRYFTEAAQKGMERASAEATDLSTGMKILGNLPEEAAIKAGFAHYLLTNTKFASQLELDKGLKASLKASLDKAIGESMVKMGTYFNAATTGPAATLLAKSQLTDFAKLLGKESDEILAPTLKALDEPSLSAMSGAAQVTTIRTILKEGGKNIVKAVDDQVARKLVTLPGKTGIHKFHSNMAVSIPTMMVATAGIPFLIGFIPLFYLLLKKKKNEDVCVNVFDPECIAAHMDDATFLYILTGTSLATCCCCCLCSALLMVGLPMMMGS